ncbi:metal-dependent hydrolase [Guptibacillus algicola]|uniref:metal-dependent hydrolase n=1 Tax=Guptibacillus algicola TaxID=225844 RepID=UPI001CD2D36F|nr:metal-dependent hydrolase [Alkalihalobacillus algicola]MCA0986341.1 metal-dependent hydrolase [Alkalihalobacillus algicola]
MQVTFHGHSVVEIVTDKAKILVDPFITGNEQCDLDANEVTCDVILLTHGHNDHVGDTVEIAKRNDALVVAPFELATYLGWKELNTHPMHIGGAHEFDFGTVKLTQAFHGSSYMDEDSKQIIYTGMPAGILFTAEGKTVYHAGDTALYSDMKLLSDVKIDLAFIPIGDNFTMGPDDAAIATEWINADLTVPVHYNTFPVIEQNPETFVDKLKNNKGKVMKPGDTVKL